MSDTLTTRLLRLSAFTDDPGGGNPAGVWLGSALPGAAEMQRIAADVGYSETAFLVPAGDRRLVVRYYSPEAEVSFCGHATIASGVALGELEGEGTFVFETAVGNVPVDVRREGDGFVASLTSVETKQRPVDRERLASVLDALGWETAELDRAIPPREAFAGAWHLVIAVADRSTLDRLDYDFLALKKLMLESGLTTLQLIWRESEKVFHSRNPFPVGGVVEDPATGAAAAALGGYLRDAGLMTAPFEFTIRQGEVMGRPSRLLVNVPDRGGVVVTGGAVSLDRRGE